MRQKVMRKENTLSTVLLAVTIFSVVNCGNHELSTRAYPIVNTYTVSNINENYATLDGEILNLGESGVSDYGFVYNSYPGTTIDNSNIISLGEKSSASKFSSLANRDFKKGGTYYVKAYAIGRKNNIIVYGQEVSFVSLGGIVPVLNDFEPKQGQVGDTIVFVGSGFSNIDSDNQIGFHGAFANPFKSRPDSLWCVVPATTAVGQNSISLIVGQYSIASTNKFILNKLIINSFSPSQVSFGDTITITGSSIPRQEGLILVKALGQTDTIVGGNSTQLKVKVSSLVVIPSSIITITTGTQSVSTTTNISLIKPVITAFSPTQGKEYIEVQINGNHFSPIKQNNIVTMNNVNLFVAQASTTSLSIYIPAGITPGDYSFTVSVATQAATSSASFKLLP